MVTGPLHVGSWPLPVAPGLNDDGVSPGRCRVAAAPAAGGEGQEPHRGQGDQRSLQSHVHSLSLTDDPATTRRAVHRGRRARSARPEPRSQENQQIIAIEYRVITNGYHSAKCHGMVTDKDQVHARSRSMSRSGSRRSRFGSSAPEATSRTWNAGWAPAASRGRSTRRGCGSGSGSRRWPASPSPPWWSPGEGHLEVPARRSCSGGPAPGSSGGGGADEHDDHGRLVARRGPSDLDRSRHFRPPRRSPGGPEVDRGEVVDAVPRPGSAGADSGSG